MHRLDIAPEIGDARRVGHGARRIRAFVSAETVLGDVDRQAVAGADLDQTVAEGVGMNRPVDRRMGEVCGGRPEREAERRIPVRPGVDRRIVVEAEPVDRAADAAEVARLDIGLHRRGKARGIGAENLRVRVSVVPIGAERLGGLGVGGGRGQARLIIVDCPNQRTGHRRAKHIDRRTVGEVHVMDRAPEHGGARKAGGAVAEAITE